MKRLIVIVVVLAAALLLQLTFVNGLPLPGGGAPDLVLLCVVAIGLAGGTEAGLIAGFCAGLALDLAPPASELIGQYALVFCLIGYGSGRMRFTLRRSAVLAFGIAATAAIVGELLAACLILVLDTPQVTLATVTQVLPSTLLYDLLLSPLVLFVAVRIAVALGVSFNPLDDSPALERGGSAAPVGLAGLGWRRAPNTGLSGAGLGRDGVAAGSGAWLTGDSVAAAAAVGSVGWLTGPARSRRQRREQARLTAALTGAVPRKGAFWVGSRPAGLQHVTSTVAAPSGLHKLRPDSGVAGSAARDGLRHRRLAGQRPAPRPEFSQDQLLAGRVGRVGRPWQRRPARSAVRHRQPSWQFACRQAARRNAEDSVRLGAAEGAEDEHQAVGPAEVQVKVRPVGERLLAGRLAIQGGRTRPRRIRQRRPGQGSEPGRDILELRAEPLALAKDRQDAQEADAAPLAVVVVMRPGDGGVGVRSASSGPARGQWPGDSIGGPLLSLPGRGATATLALRCCGDSIAEPTLSLRHAPVQHRWAIDAVSGGRLSAMPGLRAEPGRAAGQGGSDR